MAPLLQGVPHRQRRVSWLMSLGLGNPRSRNSWSREQVLEGGCGGRVARNLVDFDWNGLLNWVMNSYFGTGFWLCRRMALRTAGHARDGTE